MKKSLFDKAPPPGSKGLGKAQFLSQVNEIKEALDLGWSAKAIWKKLYDEKLISVQYRVFSQYVKELIKGEKKASNSASQIKTTEIEKPASGDNQEQGKKPHKPIKFSSSQTSNTVRPRLAKDVDDDEIF